MSLAFVVIGLAFAGGAVAPLQRQIVYRLSSDNLGEPPAGRPFVASTGDPPVERFAVAGDVGTGDANELRTAAEMARIEGDDDYDALLLLGDNVYPDGDPTMVDATVLDPFADVLDGRTRLLAVLGNHDVHDANGDAQAAALGMPNRWYADTLGPVLVIGLDSNDPGNPDQLSWLEQTLAASDATWKIVMLHHPPYSAGFHGSDLAVREAFQPLFDRYGVQLVLAGHDHDYQRSRPIGPTTYVVSGGAATLRAANRASFTAVAWSTYHFLDISVWPYHMRIQAIDQDGNVFDEVTLRTSRAGDAA